MKVFVAMSGGVDSSVAAALLKEQGHEVTGVTMCLDISGEGGKKPSCCGTQGIADAKRVSDILGIPHYVLNFGAQMQAQVIDDFVREYVGGRTPNPCIRCNELIKFEVLLVRSLGLGADRLATGHYAQVESSGERFFLKKAVDLSKDQSYFLYRLSQQKLSKIIFPLAKYRKEEVREKAKQLGLCVADKKESQEICFIPGSYGDFLKQRMQVSAVPGDIVDWQGKTVGRHKGIVYYTIGQRGGLGLACGEPVYVSAIEADKNIIRIDRKQGLMRSRFLVGDMVFPSGEIEDGGIFNVRIRHLSCASAARVSRRGENYEVCFENKVFAVTPGQSAVFYDGDTVAGGGFIQEVYA